MSARPSDRPLSTRRQQTGVHLNAARALRAMAHRAGLLLAAEGFEDLTPAQGNALVILFDAREPLKASDLARAMSLSRVTVGRFLKSLERAGWITREPDPTDGRAHRIRLTPKAYERLPAMIRVSNTMLDAAFEGFADAEIAALHSLTQRIWRNLESEPPP